MSRGLPYQISLKKLRLSETFANWDRVFVSRQLKTSLKLDFSFDLEKFEHFAIFEQLKYSNVLKI